MKTNCEFTSLVLALTVTALPVFAQDTGDLDPGARLHLTDLVHTGEVSAAAEPSHP
jgi:hypothetical protein